MQRFLAYGVVAVMAAVVSPRVAQAGDSASTVVATVFVDSVADTPAPTQGLDGMLRAAVKAHGYGLAQPTVVSSAASQPSALQAVARQHSARGAVYAELSLGRAHKIRGTLLVSVAAQLRVRVIDAASAREVGNASITVHRAATGLSEAAARASRVAFEQAVGIAWRTVGQAWTKDDGPAGQGVSISLTGVRKWRAVHRVRKALVDARQASRVSYRRVLHGKVQLRALGQPASAIVSILRQHGFSPTARGNHVSVRVSGGDV